MLLALLFGLRIHLPLPLPLHLSSPPQCEIQVPVGANTWSYSVNMTVRVDPYNSQQLQPTLVWGQVTFLRNWYPVVLGNSAYYPFLYPLPKPSPFQWAPMFQSGTFAMGHPGGIDTGMGPSGAFATLHTLVEGWDRRWTLLASDCDSTGVCNTNRPRLMATAEATSNCW